MILSKNINFLSENLTKNILKIQFFIKIFAELFENYFTFDLINFNIR
jgi:hypothetical protein